MKKKLLYTLTALMAVTATSCKDEEIVGAVSPADFDRMPRTMFCTQESTGEDKETNLHCVTEELNTIYVSWFKVKDAAGYQVRYADGGIVNASGEQEEVWQSALYGDIFVGKNVLDVLSDDIKRQAVVMDNIEDLRNIRVSKNRYVIVPEDVNELYLINLEYGTNHRFAIKVLSPRGEEHNSEWWGYGDSQHWGEQCGEPTEDRYPEPDVITYSSRGKTSIGVTVNLRSAEALDGASAEELASYKNNFEWNSDSTMFIADMIRVKADDPTAKLDQKWIDGVPLSEFDVVNGSTSFVIDNLDQNSVYKISLVNTNIPVDVDAPLGSFKLRTAGEMTEEIFIPCTWESDTNLVAHEYQACRIDNILSEFMDDKDLPEGQVFQLEGGKLYYFGSSVSMYKGFTLETRPEDIRAGKGRAKVYMGGLVSKKGNKDIGTVGQLVLGRASQDGDGDNMIPIQKIAFRNLDIEAPEALNYGAAIEQGTGATGNYFLNMLGSGVGIHFDELEIRNCTFQGLIRGFFRLQGSRKKVFDKMTVDNCVFYNCGYYASNGNSYSMFAGDGASAKSNPWMDFQFTNNTIYDSPWVNIFLPDNNKDLSYPESVKWSIRVENNTFINFNTRAAGRNLFAMRYVPSGSFISFKNNLIVLAADDRDIRDLNNTFGDVRNINGTTAGIPQMTLDVENNYSVGCRDAHFKIDGIWTSGAPSASNNSFGKFWASTPGLLQSGEDHALGNEALQTKIGQVALLATELFKNPNPPFFAHDPNVFTARDHEAPANIWDALRIVPSGRCTADHEIIVKQVGAPRWYSSNPETFVVQE